MFSSKRFGALACMFACGLLTCSSSLMAASDTWDGSDDTAWATSNNWAGAGVVPGTGDTATFDTSVTPANQPSVAGNTTVGTITIDDSGDNSYTITVANGITLTVETAINVNETSGAVQTIAGTDGTDDLLALGNGATITVVSGGALTLDGNLVVDLTAGDVNLANAGTVTVASVIQGANGIAVTGGGTTTLSGANTFTGTLTVTSGTVDVTGTLADTAAVTVADAATAIYSVENSDTIGVLTTGAAGIVELNANTLTVTGAASNVAGVVQGTGNLTYNSNGNTMTLAGANTFTGTLTVTDGTVDVTGSLADTADVVVANAGSAVYSVEASDTIGALTTGAAGLVELNANTLTVTEASDVDGVVQGTGNLTFNGNGLVMSLDNANTFTGTLTVTDGTVDVTGSLADTADVVVADTATATYSVEASDTIGALTTGAAGIVELNANTLTVTEASTVAGVVQGTGSLTFNDGGNGYTMTLGGANTFTGTLTVTDGTVDVTGSLADTADVVVADLATAIYSVEASDTIGALTTGANGIVELNANTLTVTEASDIDGVVQGTGNLTFNGNGLVMSLDNANTFTGTLTVTDGTVDVTGSLADTADVVVADLATAIYSVEASDTIGALTTGANGIVELNANTLTLTETSTAAGVIQGTGNLTFNSVGNTLTLGAANTFSGDLNITTGTVSVTGTLNDLTDVVLADGTCTYSVGADDTVKSVGFTANAGTLNLNSSHLTTTDATNLTGVTVNLTATSADSAGGTVDGNHGAFTSGAGLIISGTTLNVNFATVLNTGDVLTVLESTALTNDPTDAAMLAVTDNSASLDLTASKVGEDVVLTVARTGYATINTSTSTNVGNVATALDELVAANVAGQGATLIAALDNMNAAQQNVAYEQLSPEANASTASAAMAANGAFSGQQMGRTGDIRMAMSGSAPMGPAGPTGAYGQGIGVWGKTFGSWYDQDSRGGYNGFESDTYGIVAGVDYTMENWAFGATFGYATTDVDFDASNDAETEIDGYNFGLYTTYARDAWYVDGGFTYVYSDIDSRRKVTGIDTITGEYDADTYVWYMGYGYDFECTNALTVTPTIKMAYTLYDQESYDEDGVGGMDMDSFDQDSFTTTLGVNLGYKFSEMVTGNLRMSWEHEYMDNQGVAKGSLYGAEFTTKGLEPDDDTFVIGTGVSAQFDEYTSAYLDYDYEFCDDADGHNLTLGVRFEF